MSNKITTYGNLTGSPELRYTANGKPVANFTVAYTPREYDKQQQKWVDGKATFMRCVLWGAPAEHIAALPKGCRVIVVGDLQQRDWETREGEKRTSYEINVDELGVSTRFGTVTPPVRDVVGTKPGQGGNGWGDTNQAAIASGNGWAAPAATYDTEAPF